VDVSHTNLRGIREFEWSLENSRNQSGLASTAKETANCTVNNFSQRQGPDPQEQEQRLDLQGQGLTTGP